MFVVTNAQLALPSEHEHIYGDLVPLDTLARWIALGYLLVCAWCLADVVGS
jgi:hypothetical protein